MCEGALVNRSFIFVKQRGKEMDQKNNNVDKGMWILGGASLMAGLGAGLMYLFDPERGERRRATLREKCLGAMRQVGDAVSSVRGAYRDLSDRPHGLLAGAKHWLRGDEVDDETLVARVRSQLGHAISQPSSIEVSAGKGAVILNGSIPTDELNDLITCVTRVRGVKEVESHLKVMNPSSSGASVGARSGRENGRRAAHAAA
jgi:osmotically-inducible protein OsmY